MDRSEWIAERRHAAEAAYDELFASYDDDDVPITSTHRRFVTEVLERSSPGGRILDAPCGTGKYFAMILASGREVLGIDQSAGMLAAANAKQPDVRTEKMGLQELDFDAAFDGAICVDAMEHVFPEDWPGVLGNLRRAVRPEGPVYLTVETVEESLLEAAFVEARAQGLPVVRGETARGGGYHYYPSLDQVAAWIEEAGMAVILDGRSEGTGYGYEHLLCASR